MRTLRANKEDIFREFEFSTMGSIYYLDLKTCETVFVSDFNDSDENAKVRALMESDPDRSAAFPQQDSRWGYDNMTDFAENVKDSELREKLAIALNGRGAFRRFKDVLLDHPDERAKWFEFEEKRRRKLFDEWLKGEQIEIMP